MSSILKALRKLDTEKKARRPDSFNIDAEILRGDTRPRISTVRIVLTAIVLFICGGTVTYLYMKQETSQVVGTRVANEVTVPTERIIPETIVPAQATPKTKMIPTSPAISGRAPSSGSKGHSGQASQAEPVLRKNSKIDQAQPERSVQKPQATVGPAATQTKPVPGQRAGQAPLLRVNGIAFQDGVDSAAIINGVQVSKGSFIEGVRVVDIQRDRVIFSLNGENFEIALGRSNR